MTGSIKTKTPKYKFIIPQFNIATWHDYIEDNFRAIDALFYNIFDIHHFSGSWTKTTKYKKDQVLFIGEDYEVDETGQLKKDDQGELIVSVFSGNMVKVLKDHTTDNSDYFSLYYFNHKDEYELFADASTAQVFANLAKQYSKNAQQSENNAELYKNNTQSYAQEANNSRNVAQLSAQFAKKQEELATTSATIAKNSENSAANSAILAEDYKNDAKLWAVGTITEKPEGSSKYWAEQAQQTAQVYDATETVKGIIRLATSNEVKTGTNDSAAITPKKLKNNYVSKSGDKMTGTLTNDGVFVSQIDNVNYIARSKSLVKGTTPTDSDKYVGYDWQDKNRQRLAYLGVVYNTSGVKKLELQKIDNNLSEFNINFAIRNLYNFYFQDTQHTLGNVDVNTWINNQIQFQDNKGTRLARIQPMLASNGTLRLCLAASKGTESESSLVIGSDGYTQCPKPADDSNTNAIATTNWAGGLNRANTWLAPNTFKGAIDLSPANNPNHGGYIDFHYNGDTGDFTSRIIESSKGTITFTSNTLTHGTAKFLVSPKTQVNGNARYKSVCDGYTKGTAPATTQFGGISTTDKNGVEVATFYSTIDTNSTIKSALAVRQPTAAGTESREINIYCDKNGKFHTSCGVSSNENNSIVTTVSHGSDYVRFGNGLQICWGNNSTGQTITLPQPFKDANYKITFCQTDGGEHNINQVVADKTATMFRFSRGYTGDWIAIGYWY